MDVFDEIAPDVESASQDVFDLAEQSPQPTLVAPPVAPVFVPTPIERPPVSEAVKESTWKTLSPTDKLLASDLGRAGKAGISGFGSALEGAGIAASALPPVANDMGGPYNPADAELLSRWQKRRETMTPAEMREDVVSNPAYQAGGKIKAFAEKTFPSIQPDSVNRPLGALGEGAGSTVSFLPGSVLGPFGVAGLGALQNGAIAYEDAIKAGAPEDKAQDAFFINAAGGVTEALPIASIFKRLNKATGGSVWKAIKQMAVSGLEEGAQEVFQSVLQNASAKHLYDKERKYLEGLATSGGVGFGVGFLLAGLGIGTRRAAARVSEAVELKRENDVFDQAVEQSAKRAAMIGTLPGVSSQVEITPTEQQPPEGAITAGTGRRVQQAIRQRQSALSGKQTEAEAVAAEIGASFKPFSAVQMKGLDTKLAAQLEAARKKNGWEFTPQPGSPIAGRTFYVPEGASRETILKRYQEKLNEERIAEPTEAQKEAGNYKKGHVNLHGFDISIENKAGSERTGTDKGGKAWSVTMPADYGYIRRTEGKDGDQLDVYLGTNPESQKVFVVDQINPDTGQFDEHKSFIGFNSQAEVQATYDAAFSDNRGPERRKNVSEMTVDQFKEWVKNGDLTQPVLKGGDQGVQEKEVQGQAVLAPQPAAASPKAAVIPVTKEDVGPRLEGMIQKRLRGEKLTAQQDSLLKRMRNAKTPEPRRDYAKYQQRLAQEQAKIKAGEAVVQPKQSGKRKGDLEAQGKRGWDLIDEAESSIGKISWKLIKEANPNWLPVGAARKIFAAEGIPADTAAQTLFESGHYKGDPGQVDQFGDAMNAAALGRKGNRATQARETRLLNEADRQRTEFEEDATKQTKRTEPVLVDELQVGDKFTLNKHELKVTDLTFDEDGRIESITFDDGKKYGTQQVDNQTLLGALRQDKGSLVKAEAEADADFLTPEDEAEAEDLTKYPVRPEYPTKDQLAPGENVIKKFSDLVNAWKDKVRAWLKTKPENKGLVWRSKTGNGGSVYTLTRDTEKPWRVTRYWTRNDGTLMSNGHDVYENREDGLFEYAKNDVEFLDALPGRVLTEQEIQGYQTMDDVADKATLIWYQLPEGETIGRFRERLRNNQMMQGFVYDSITPDRQVAFTKELPENWAEQFGVKKVEPEKPKEPELVKPAYVEPKFKEGDKVMVGEYPMTREGTIAAFGPFKDGEHWYFVNTNLGREQPYREADLKPVEAKPEPKPPDKQPWQMSKSEWDTHQKRGTWADFTDPELTEARAKEKAAYDAIKPAEEARKKLGTIEPLRRVMQNRDAAMERNKARRDSDKKLQAARDEYSWASRRVSNMQTQEAFIERAIKRGETIPDEVMAEFPELKKPAVAEPEQVAPVEPVKQTLKFKQGDDILFVPKAKGQIEVSGQVVEVIYNTEGEVGYHILSPLPNDPARQIRIWERDGTMAIAVKPVEKQKLEPGQSEISRDQALALVGGRKNLLPEPGETKLQPQDASKEYYLGQTKDGRFFTQHIPKEAAPAKPAEPSKLSPRQLKRLSELVKKQRAADEGGGPVLTSEENTELSDLRSVGQADLLAEPEGANEAAQRGEIVRLRAKAEELVRQSGLALNRYNASQVQEVAAKHRDDANKLAQEAAAVRAEADRMERALRGEKPQGPAQQDDMFGGRDASLPQSERAENEVQRAGTPPMSNAALRREVNKPDSGVPAEMVRYINALLDSGLTNQIPGLRWAIDDAIHGGATGEYLPNSRLARFSRFAESTTPIHEFFHDVWYFLKPEDQDAIRKLREETVKSELGKPRNYAEVSALEKMLSDQVTSDDFIDSKYPHDIYHLSNEREFFTWLMTDRAAKQFDAKPEAKTLVGRIKDVLQKLLTAFKDAFGLSPKADALWRKILSGKYEFTPEEGREQEARELSLPEPLKQAVEVFDRKSAVDPAAARRAVEIGQAANVLARQGVVQGTLANLERITREDVTTPQAKWLRDLARKVMANPFIRNTLRRPVEQLNASARFTGDSIESYRTLKAKPDATPEQISNAAGEAVNNLVSFEKRVQDFNSQFMSKRQSLVNDIAKFTELEMEAYDKLDLEDVLFDDFRRMALPILQQSNDTTALQAYTYAMGRGQAVRNVLAWIGHEVDLTGATTPADVLNRIREAGGRSRIQESIEQQIGAERGVIQAVARILALVEPVRERLIEARFLYEQQAGTRSTELKQRLERLVRAGSYARALEVFERGAEKLGAAHDRARRELDFYARRTRSRLLALRALDETRSILNNIVDDPEFKAEKQEIFSEDAQHVRNVMMDVRGATFVLKPFGGMTDELKLTFGNPSAESRASLERIKAYRDRAAAYIADPDSDPAVVEGLKAIFPLLDQFLNPAVAPEAARLLPNFMQKAFHTIARLVFKTERIPYYLLQGAGGTWKALGDATLRARRDMGEQLQRINKQHFPRLSLTLHAALQSHGGVTPDTYFEKVWNHLAGSRQNFRDIRYLGIGDPIGNGEKVTREDLAFLEAYRKFHTDLSATSQNIGKRSFSSFRSVLTGIFFDNDGRIRLPFAHGVDMVNRRQPPQYEIENWLSKWKLARTPEAKTAFLNEHLDRLVIGYAHGVNQADWVRKFRYSYEDQIRETLAESGEQPIDSFETLAERVWEKVLETEPEVVPTFEDIRDNLLGDFDNIFRKLERLDSTEKQSDPKNIVETVRSEREFNTERGDVFMPPNWYDYGGVTEGQWSSVSRASMFPYERAHLVAMEGLKESLSGIVKDFQAQAIARGGFRGYFKTKRESRKARERGDVIYSWADAKDLLEKVTHYAAGLKMMAESPNLLTQTDRPYAILQSGVTQLPVAMVLFRLGAASRNLFGGYTNAVLADMQFRNRSWPVAVAAQVGQLVADTYKNTMTLLVHEGNPVGRKVHSILSDASNWAIVGPIAENFLKAIDEQRQLYRDAAELGLNLNVALWDSLSTLRKFSKTAGNVREPSSPLERIYSVPAAALRAGGLVFGQAGVGRIDSWINAKALVQARQYEQIYKKLARKYGEQVVAIGAKQFPPGAFGGLTTGGQEHKALRVREFFTRMAGMDIDAAMLAYYQRWSEAKTREETEGVKEGTFTDTIDLFTEDQRNTLAVATADDFNLATFSNRPYSTKMHAALNTLGLFYGYPDWWIHKILSMANTNSRKGIVAGRLENMPFLLNMAIAFAIASILGMEGVEWLKEYLLNQKSAYPTMTDAKTAPAAARAAAGAIAFNLPFIGGAMSAAFDLGYHGSNNPYDLFFVPGLAKNATMVGVETWQTGDPILPIMRFADRYLLPIPSHKMTETTAGSRAMVNTGNILEMSARANDDEEKLKPRDGAGFQHDYTPATPLITRAMNAIGNGDMPEFQKQYTALVEEYRKQGKADPERNARQSLMTRNPISQRFAKRPSDAEFQKYLAGLTPIERKIVTETLENYRQAMGIIGASPSFTAEGAASRAGSSSGASKSALPPSALPTSFRTSGGQRTRSTARPRRIRGVRTKLTAGRRRTGRIRIRKPRRVRFSFAIRRPRRIRIQPRSTFL